MRAPARASWSAAGRPPSPRCSCASCRRCTACAASCRERLLGRLAGVSASFAHPGALDGHFDGPRAWMRDPRRAGLGGFGERALHLLDALTALPTDEPLVLAAIVLDRTGATELVPAVHAQQLLETAMQLV
jgi:hypothetical protein